MTASFTGTMFLGAGERLCWGKSTRKTSIMSMRMAACGSRQVAAAPGTLAEKLAEVKCLYYEKFGTVALRHMRANLRAIIGIRDCDNCYLKFRRKSSRTWQSTSLKWESDF